MDEECFLWRQTGHGYQSQLAAMATYVMHDVRKSAAVLRSLQQDGYNGCRYDKAVKASQGYGLAPTIHSGE